MPSTTAGSPLAAHEDLSPALIAVSPPSSYMQSLASYSLLSSAVDTSRCNDPGSPGVVHVATAKPHGYVCRKIRKSIAGQSCQMLSR